MSNIDLLKSLAAIFAPKQRKGNNRDLKPWEVARLRQRRLRELQPAGRTYMFGIRLLRTPPKDARERRELEKHVAKMASARGSQAMHSARRRPKTAKVARATTTKAD